MRRFLGWAACAAAALVLSACTMPPDTEPDSDPLLAQYPIAKDAVRFKPIDFSELPATDAEHWQKALAAFARSCTRMQTKPMWERACAAVSGVAEGEAQRFFQDQFDVYQVASAEKKRLSETGLTTGYYEPMLHGSRTQQGPYQYPLYGVPDDLIVVDLSQLHPQLKGLRLRGKLQGRKLVPYDSRSDIHAREDLKDNVLCWVDDPVEAFFLQIQGSGRVLLDDGTFMRVGYGDQNGHPYKAISNWLIENAGLTRDEMSMQRIKRWVQDNPQRRDELLDTNPNFVFFAERLGFGPQDGPLGAQSVPLTDEASVAVDRRHWPLGLPFVIAVEQSNPPLAFARPVIAQDTGGAIKGVIRFDYFWGYGDQAGQRAGAQKSRTQAWALIPKGVRPESI